MATSGAVPSSVTSEVASVLAREAAQDMQRNFAERSCSLRLLALLTALALMVTAVLGFIAEFLTLHWITAAFEILVFALGLLILVLESGGSSRGLSLFTGIETVLYRYAPFLR
jgi:uncharacterized membrane protein